MNLKILRGVNYPITDSQGEKYSIKQIWISSLENGKSTTYSLILDCGSPVELSQVKVVDEKGELKVHLLDEVHEKRESPELYSPNQISLIRRIFSLADLKELEEIMCELKEQDSSSFGDLLLLLLIELDQNTKLP